MRKWTIQKSRFLHPTGGLEFKRNGKSTVSYSGQTDRLNQLQDIKTKVQLAADNGTLLNAAELKAMFENENGNANGLFSFSSTNDLTLINFMSLS